MDEGFARAFGLDSALGREGLSLAQVVETVHPDDKAGLAKAIGEAIARGGAYAHQYRVRRADGRYYWIEANGRVDHAPDATPLSFPGVLIDVEERRAVAAERDRATALLREKAVEFETLADNIPALCWMARADGHIYWYNRRWYDYTGTDAESMQGWGWKAVHDPAALPGVTERWQHSIATGERFDMTFPAARPGRHVQPLPDPHRADPRRDRHRRALVRHQHRHHRSACGPGCPAPAQRDPGGAGRRSHRRARSDLAGVERPSGRGRFRGPLRQPQPGLERHAGLERGRVEGGPLPRLRPPGGPGIDARGRRQPRPRRDAARFREPLPDPRRGLPLVLLEHRAAPGAHLRLGARRHRDQGAGPRPGRGRGGPAPVAEDGGGGPAHRWPRPRLQQLARRHLGQPGADADPHQPGPAQGCRPLHGRRPRRGQARCRADPPPARLLPPPDAGPAAHRREPAGDGHGGSDPAHGRSHHHHRGGGGGRALALPRRSAAARECAAQPLHQRPRRDARGRAHHHRDRQQVARCPCRAPARRSAGPVPLAVRDRYRHRHEPGRAGQGVRPVLHDQAHRPGHGSRPVDDLRLRQADGRAGADLFRTRPGHDGLHLPAPLPRRGGGSRFARPPGRCAECRAG
ncbi:protein of unknown function [Methylorubrum extorquens]|uniref:histidine kinase n=1 Tax=Methylorubrum extorquens TaxID=408 RepID=A0A2N9AUZ3_METEX|nr:protein of unknown function [Methylorubrum extorquens]